MSLATDFASKKRGVSEKSLANLKKFEPGNPGRPKGCRNKLGEQFISDLYEDWQANGKQVLEDTRAQNPAVYMRVVASLLPKDVNLNVGLGEQLSDDELAAGLMAVRAALAARGISSQGDGAKVIDGVVQAERVSTGSASPSDTSGT